MQVMMPNTYSRLSLPFPPNPVTIIDGEPPQAFYERFILWLQDTAYLKEESTVQLILADLINYSRDSRVVYNPENIDIRFLVAITISALKRDLDVRAQASTMKDTVIPEIQQLIQSTQDEKKTLQEKYEKLYEEKKKLQDMYDKMIIDRRSKLNELTLERELKEEKIKTGRLKKELEELKATEASTLAENIEIKSQLTKLEEEKDELKVDLDLQKAAYQTLKNNTGTTRNKSSDYLGVRKINNSTVNRSKPWSAHIRKDGKQVYLGVYATEEEAAEAYLYAKTPTLKAIKEELEQLKASSPDLTRMQTENAQLRTTLEQYSKEITQLEKKTTSPELSTLELESKTRLINQLKGENARLRQSITDHNQLIENHNKLKVEYEDRVKKEVIVLKNRIEELQDENARLIHRGSDYDGIVKNHNILLEQYQENAHKVVEDLQKKIRALEQKNRVEDPVKITIVINPDSELRKENYHLKEELSQWSMMYQQRSTEWKEEIVKEKEDNRRIVLFLNQKITALENEIKEEMEPLSKRQRKPVELFQPYTWKDLYNKHKRGRQVLKIEEDENENEEK